MRWLHAWLQRVVLGDVTAREAAMQHMCAQLREFRALLGTVYAEVAHTQAAVDVLLARCEPPQAPVSVPGAPIRPPREFTAEDRQVGHHG